MGDLATWFTGIIATVGLFGAWLAYQLSRKVRDDEIERARRQQATQLSSWLTLLGTIEPGQYKLKPCGTALSVSNSSAGPVYDVVIIAVASEKQQKAFTAVVLPPGDYFARWLGYPGSSSNQTWDFLATTEELDRQAIVQRPYTASGNWKVASMTFTDASGIRWTRDMSSDLREVSGR